MSTPILTADDEAMAHRNLRDEHRQLVGVVHHAGKNTWWLHPIGRAEGRQVSDGAPTRHRSLKAAMAYRAGMLGDDGRDAYMMTLTELGWLPGEELVPMSDLDPGMLDSAMSYARYVGLSWPPNRDTDLALGEVELLDRRRDHAAMVGGA